MPRRTFTRLISAPDEWDRRRLQILLSVAVVVIAVVVAGVVWSVASMLGGSQSSAGNDHPVARRDGVAKDELASAGLEDAKPGPLTTGSTGTITIPPPSALGQAQVQTGFPHTAEGALAQLIAIDRRAIESASVVTAQEVITEWAARGGPTSQTWSGVRAIADLLSSAGLPADGSRDVTIELRPAMALINGSVGEEPVVPCVDFVLAVTPVGGTSSKVAVADCQRMVWRENRWVIGAGAEPTSAPSIWPGTQASYDAGYQWIETAP